MLEKTKKDGRTRNAVTHDGQSARRLRSSRYDHGVGGGRRKWERNSRTCLMLRYVGDSKVAHNNEEGQEHPGESAGPSASATSGEKLVSRLTYPLCAAPTLMASVKDIRQTAPAPKLHGKLDRSWSEKWSTAYKLDRASAESDTHPTIKNTKESPPRRAKAQ